jgi:SagB-type dehydrogenase family enzyme
MHDGKGSDDALRVREALAGGRTDARTNTPGIDWDDPAELFHEASSNYRAWSFGEGIGYRELEWNESLVEATRYPGKRFAHRPRHRLPDPDFGEAKLEDALGGRATTRTFGNQSLSEGQLGTALFAAYGRLRRDSDLSRRTVPSGGALYPLDLYVSIVKVLGVREGLYLYDPNGHCLELIRAGDAPNLSRCLVHREVGENAACFVVIAASFWRSRFKYSLRGYRFTLIEAGHTMQNLVLAAAALGFGAAPLGGFFDRELAEDLHMDGVGEAPLYVAVLGSLAE